MVKEFLNAAFPWIIEGIALAVVFTSYDKYKKGKRK